MWDSEDNGSFTHVLNECRRLVNARLNSVLESNKPPLLYEPIEHIIASGGKRVRPTLLILACKALGGKAEACLDAAVAVELLHNFTLVHDDIMDQDRVRRGRPTIHAKWNSDIAILAGDALFGLAYKTLLNTDSPRIQQISQVFTDGVMDLCEGQALDSDFEQRSEVRLPDYLNMIGKKTARLLSVSAEIGAMIADGSERQIKAMRDFGFNLGCAFQIQDDLLDITADEAKLGKTLGSDIRRRKQTFLLVHAMSESDRAMRQRLDEILDSSTIDRAQILAVRDAFAEIGSIQAAQDAIGDYLAAAETSLQGIGPSTGHGDLRSILNFLANRVA